MLLLLLSVSHTGPEIFTEISRLSTGQFKRPDIGIIGVARRVIVGSIEFFTIDSSDRSDRNKMQF